jgi:hypothetical protein
MAGGGDIISRGNAREGAAVDKGGGNAVHFGGSAKPCSPVSGLSLLSVSIELLPSLDITHGKGHDLGQPESKGASPQVSDHGCGGCRSSVRLRIPVAVFKALWVTRLDPAPPRAAAARCPRRPSEARLRIFHAHLDRNKLAD